MPSKSLLYLMALSLLGTGAIYADPPDPIQEDVLRPVERRPLYGAFFAGNAVFTSGTLVTTCDCTYESGDGFGFAGGGFFELPIIREVSIIGQLAYDGLGAKYIESEKRLEYIDDGDFQFLDFEKQADVSLAYFNVEALLKWNIGGRELYVLAGPSVGWSITGTISEKEKIISPGYTYYATGSNDKLYLDDVPLSDVYDVNDLRIALRLGFGYEISATDRMIIIPEASYTIPFSTVADGFKNAVGPGRINVDGWKHSALQIAVKLAFLL